MTFESRNVNDLTSKLEAMWQHTFDYKEIALTSQKRYNSESYYQSILKIYQ